MFRGDVQRTGAFPPGGPTTIDGAAWAFETGDRVLSSPVVSGGTVYVGSADGRLYAIDAETGQEQWAFETDGPVGSPAVSGGTVYVGSNDGSLYAVE